MHGFVTLQSELYVKCVTEQRHSDSTELGFAVCLATNGKIYVLQQHSCTERLQAMLADPASLLMFAHGARLHVTLCSMSCAICQGVLDVVQKHTGVFTAALSTPESHVVPMIFLRAHVKSS